ncbi:hypothetical protein [Cognatiyoonia koreensis]|nr:hypothetical protein [Cognatiyoonia koreensis]
MRIVRQIMCSTALLALGGCLGGDIVTPSEARNLSSRTDAYAALRDRNSDVPNSAWDAMPTQGQARFDGAAAVRFGPDNARTRLAGDVSLTVDYATGGIDGQIDRLFGVDGSNDLAEYRGQLRVGDGRIGVDRPNDWSAGYSGTLRGNGDRIVSGGTIRGDFQGTPVRTMEGRSDGSDTALVNGVEMPFRVDIVAEQKTLTAD